MLFPLRRQSSSHHRKHTIHGPIQRDRRVTMTDLDRMDYTADIVSIIAEEKACPTLRFLLESWCHPQVASLLPFWYLADCCLFPSSIPQGNLLPMFLLLLAGKNMAMISSQLLVIFLLLFLSAWKHVPTCLSIYMSRVPLWALHSLDSPSKRQAIIVYYELNYYVLPFLPVERACKRILYKLVDSWT